MQIIVKLVYSINNFANRYFWFFPGDIIFLLEFTAIFLLTNGKKIIPMKLYLMQVGSISFFIKYSFLTKVHGGTYKSNSKKIKKKKTLTRLHDYMKNKIL